MDYDYACFISYKRPPTPIYPPGVIPRKPTKHIWSQLAETFEQKLDQYLTSNIRIFRDQILVALVVPEYFESKWCLAEWAAMERFESNRLGEGKHELTIPVVCVGEIEKLKNYFETRLSAAIDMRNIVSPSKQLSTLENLRKIEDYCEDN